MVDADLGGDIAGEDVEAVEVQNGVFWAEMAEGESGMCVKRGRV